ARNPFCDHERHYALSRRIFSGWR
ncbi:MAG: hypothetical protein QG594_1352, partial [Bacteroidota bacterium]|nr:hypothetical protein [Bacteroidota bacterium]